MFSSSASSRSFILLCLSSFAFQLAAAAAIPDKVTVVIPLIAEGLTLKAKPLGVDPEGRTTYEINQPETDIFNRVLKPATATLVADATHVSYTYGLDDPRSGGIQGTIGVVCDNDSAGTAGAVCAPFTANQNALTIAAPAPTTLDPAFLATVVLDLATTTSTTLFAGPTTGTATVGSGGANKAGGATTTRRSGSAATGASTGAARIWSPSALLLSICVGISTMVLAFL
ncbi:hypothetical protein MKEN_01026500 [Mycena kentingensis (nom. inval.)]|nr:hypothetical protein MKEN_01026500 [Mycena kentingensis (nom. inval.)]